MDAAIGKAKKAHTLAREHIVRKHEAFRSNIRRSTHVPNMKSGRISNYTPYIDQQAYCCMCSRVCANPTNLFTRNRKSLNNNAQTLYRTVQREYPISYPISMIRLEKYLIWKSLLSLRHCFFFFTFQFFFVVHPHLGERVKYDRSRIRMTVWKNNVSKTASVMLPGSGMNEKIKLKGSHRNGDKTMNNKWI